MFGRKTGVRTRSRVGAGGFQQDYESKSWRMFGLINAWSGMTKRLVRVQSLKIAASVKDESEAEELLGVWTSTYSGKSIE